MVLYTGVKFRENISESFCVMERTRNYEGLTDGRMDGRTDTQHFGRYNIMSRHFFVAGHKNYRRNVCMR